MCMGTLYVCLCTTGVLAAYGVQKKASVPLDLESHAAVGWHCQRCWSNAISFVCLKQGLTLASNTKAASAS